MPMENAITNKFRQIILDHLDDDKFDVSHLASGVNLIHSEK